MKKMTVEQLEKALSDLGYEDSMIFRNYDYAGAVVGVDHTGRVVYDFDKMVECLMEEEGWEETEAIEWIEYNTLRALPYCQDKAPIVLYNYTNVFADYATKETNE